MPEGERWRLAAIMHPVQLLPGHDLTQAGPACLRGVAAAAASTFHPVIHVDVHGSCRTVTVPKPAGGGARHMLMASAGVSRCAMYSSDMCVCTCGWPRTLLAQPSGLYYLNGAPATQEGELLAIKHAVQ
jgi:hypothetical protein